MSKRIIVIGAGPGGLAAAMLLSSKGYEVEVFEKRERIGGRNAALHMDGFTFDQGPTFLSMLHIAEELFQAANRNLHHYVEAIELREMYRLVFEDRELDMIRDIDQMQERLEKIYPGSAEGYVRYMQETDRKMKALTPILQTKMDRLMHYLKPEVIKALPELELGKSLYDVLSRYFKEEELKLAFTFQSKYLGMSPWECPGAFSILSYMEHQYGIYHLKGGINQLSQAMGKVIQEYGGNIHTSTDVKKLWIEGRTVRGIVLESGERIGADEVIINADFAHAMTHLIEPGILRKYAPPQLLKKKYSCSTFMLYLGLDKQYDLPHHTIIFSKDYKKNVEEITNTKLLSEDPSIYIQNASVTDPTLAPEGKSAIYILAPVPNRFGDIGWEDEQQSFRELVLQTIAERTSLSDIQDHIEVEKMLTPLQWEEDFSVYKGATFNLGHQLSQMMVFRPHNAFEELNHCWLVGGGTHPGSGLPTILESARITTNGILRQYGEQQIPVLPLPSMEVLG